jgi:hypothetical protein
MVSFLRAIAAAAAIALKYAFEISPQKSKNAPGGILSKRKGRNKGHARYACTA